MRNALILTGVWLGILVSAYAIVFWDQGVDRQLPISILDQQAQTMATEFVHPDGLFSMSIPVGWLVEKDVTYVEMTDPNASVTVWVLALESADLSDSLREAFALAHLGTGFALSSSAGIPEAWAGDEARFEYVSEQGDEIVSVRAIRPERVTVIMLVRGPQRSVDALSENLDWIWSHLSIPAAQLQIL